MNFFLRAGLILVSVSSGLLAQPPPSIPAPSPTATLTQRVGLTDIAIVYSRPGVKGRKIFGGTTPFGAVWRTGANEPTKVTFSTDVVLNGAEVPAGTYSLYSIPGQSDWTIIIYKDTKLWGAFGYEEKNDLVRFHTTPQTLPNRVETFTIEYADIHDDSATITLAWDRTLVPIHLTLPNQVSQVSAQIDAFAAGPGKKDDGFYYDAAQFYLHHGPDLDKALKYADAMIALKTAAFYEGVYVRAKVLQLKGDNVAAAQEAKRSKAAAIKREGPQTGWVQMNDDILNAAASASARE